MRFPRNKKLASLSPLPIILVATAQSQQLASDWLWRGIVICLLLSGASLGLTLSRTRNSTKRSKKQEPNASRDWSAYVGSDINTKIMDLEKQIFNLKSKITLNDQNAQVLDLKIKTLDKKILDIIIQSKQQFPASNSKYSPSLNKVTQDSSALPPLINRSASVEPVKPSPVPSNQQIPASHAELVIGGEAPSAVSSKLEEFSSAIEMNNGSAVRELSDAELNITKESEDALVRRELGHMTQLEEVNGGGSYYRLVDANRSWLFPTPLTLKTIAKNQPSKGLFRYEVEPISTPHIKQPAEIRPVSGNRWEVLEMGIIAVPT